MAFIFILILVCLLSAQCNVRKNIVENLSYGLRCLRSIPLSPQSTEFSSTLDLLDTYLQSYAFLDTSLNPNAGGNSYNQKSVDLQFELKDIKQETYNNTFDFYERIMVLFNSLKDPHTYFAPPCVKNFIYVLPYYFSIYPTSNGEQIVKIHYQIDPAFNKYNNSHNILLNYDTQILYINIKGKNIYQSDGTMNDGTYPAAEAIAIWADSELPTSRSSITRQNLAATGDFSYRPANQFRVPEYENVIVEYRRPNGAQSIATLPFYVMPIANIINLEDECPVNNVNSQQDEKDWKQQYLKKVQGDKNAENKISIFKRIQQWISQWKINKQNNKTNIQPQIDIERINEKIRGIQMQQTKEIQERLHPKPFESISRVSLMEIEPELPTNTTQTQNNSQSTQSKKQFTQLKTDQIMNEEQIGMYSIFNPNVGVIKIPTFYPTNRQSFVSLIGLSLNLYTSKAGQYFADRLIIDVRGNPGGYVGLGAQTLRFLFPYSGHPLFPIADQLRSQMNQELANIDLYLMANQKDQSELYVNPDYMLPDEHFFSRGGRSRHSSMPNSSTSMYVQLTEKFSVYTDHINPFIDWQSDWRMKRKPLYGPQDVIVLTDGICASTCSIFVKEIAQKHLARIVGVGVRDPRNPNARFDTGRASSASSTSVSTIQSLKKNPEFKPLLNQTNIPNDFYRKGTSFGFANSGLYGFTNESNDKLMEYEIIDPDFIYEWAPNIEEEPQTYQDYIDFYTQILNYEKQIVGNQQGQQKKCFSWEVDTAGAADKGNCKGCSKGDQHSVFGHPCSTRGKTEAEGRNIDGTSKVGVYNTNKCIFSHCKIGYYRKKITVNGVLKDQCIEIPLGYKETRSEMIPDSSLDVYDDKDQCGDPCADVDQNTPSDVCPCPTDSTKLQQDPRKDGLCKCAIITSTTPINTCPCPTDSTKLQQDPRVNGLCKCAIITSTTSIDACPCPTDSVKLSQDPRKDGLCKCAIITTTTPIDTCPCPTNPYMLSQDPRANELCKCAIVNSTTTIDTCPCPTEQSKFDNDPRKDEVCKCKVIFENTPIDTCPCPTNPTQLANDTRKNGLCKCAIITTITSIDRCPCPTNPTELASDPRANGLCKCAIVTDVTPIDACACPTDPTLLAKDPRKDGLCKCAIITNTTSIDTCPCPTDSAKLSQDPRANGLCKCAIITTNTPIETCACPTEQSLFDDDPRVNGLCKCKVIFENTSIDTCACPSDLLKLAQDPRKDGLCKCTIITESTPVDRCACPTEQSELNKDPRKDGLCKCAIITTNTPIDRCICPTEQSEFDTDPRNDGLCKCKVIFESTPIDTCECPTDSTLLSSDPRSDGLCKCAIITSNTPIDRCICPTEESELNKDPRKDGLCKCAIVSDTTPIDTCPCPTEQSKFDNDPRKDGVCKCEVIFESTPLGTCPCPTDPTLLANDPRKDGLCKCAIITEDTSIETCACPTEQSAFNRDPRANGLCKCKVIFESTPANTCACPTEQSKLDSDPRKDGLCSCAIITETTPIARCACPTDPIQLDKDPRQFGICQPETKLFELYINKQSGNDKIDRGLSETNPTRSIGYTIKQFIDSYKYRGQATFHVAAENYSENIEFKSSEHGVNIFRFVGVGKDGNTQSYPALSNGAHPNQGGLNIVGVGIHVKHFIFEYVPPMNLNEILTPMISISAGQLTDWKVLQSGQKQIIPDHLDHSFTDCIFEGSSVDFNSKKTYGYTIGPILSIIGSKVTLSDCQFTAKDNIQLLKGIPSTIISAVYLYPESGVTVINCKFENLTQGKIGSDIMLKNIGLPNLAGNEQSEIQRLNNLPPSLAIFAITDYQTVMMNQNSKSNYIDINSTIFAHSKSETARSGALLIDGFFLSNNIKDKQLIFNGNYNQQPVHNLNQLSQHHLNQISNQRSSSSSSSLSQPNYQLPIVTLNQNIFNNTQGLKGAAVTLGAGVQYGRIKNNQFSQFDSTIQNPSLINFESSAQVAESGGAQQIIGDGNQYIPPKSVSSGSDAYGTSGLFTVEGNKDASFDDASKKIAVIPVEQVIITDKSDEKADKLKKTKKLSAGVIVAIVLSIIVVIGIIALVVIGLLYYKAKQQKQMQKEKKRKRHHIMVRY